MLSECIPKNILYLSFDLVICQCFNSSGFVSSYDTQDDVVFPICIGNPERIVASSIAGDIKLNLISPPSLVELHEYLAVDTHPTLAKSRCLPRRQLRVESNVAGV
jgi:hypothetical protein